MKKSLLTLALLHVTFGSLFEEENYNGSVNMTCICGLEGGHPSLPICSHDKKGFFRVYCKWDQDDWDRDTKVTYRKCPDRQECVCDSQFCDERFICQDIGEGHPSFPKTGVLTYTGTTERCNEKGCYEAAWRGMVTLDEMGRFYTDFTSFEHGKEWIQRFFILQSVGDGFKKITGWHGNNECMVELTANEPVLFTTYDDRSTRGLKKVFEDEENGMYIQRWRTITFDDNYETTGIFDDVTYTYLYDADNNLAIPLQYNHFFEYDHEDRMDVKNFVYSPTIEDESVFDVNKYCSNLHV